MVTRTRPRSSRPSSGVFLPFDASASGLTCQVADRSMTDQVGWFAFADRGRHRDEARAEHPCRADGQRFDRTGEREVTRVDGRKDHRDRRLEAGDAVRGHAELHVLVDDGVGRMVRGDGVDGAVGEGGEAGHRLRRRPQRRVHPQRRIERRAGQRPIRPRIPARPGRIHPIPRPATRPRDPLVREREVMRRDVARDRQPALLGRAHQRQRRGRRDVRQVQSRAVARPRPPRRAPRARWPRPRPPRRPASPGARARSRHTPRPSPRQRSASRPRRARRSAGPATRHRPARSGAATETGRATRRRRSRRPRHRRARPARRASPSGDRPSWPPRSSTRTGDPEAAAAATTRPMTPGSSAAGSVLGMAHTVVNPPWAAAASPVAIVSASSRPGSRRCVCRSMNPGAIRTPPSSTPSSQDTDRTTPSSTTISATPLRPPPGSTTAPRRVTDARAPTADDASVKAAAPAPRPAGTAAPSAPPRRS